MTYTLMCIEPKRTPEVLPMVLGMLQDAYSFSDASVPPADQFESGMVLLWVAWGDEQKILAAATTALVKNPKGLTCKICACAGLNFHRWRGSLGRIEQYARDEGCYRLMFDGRLGWERLLPDFQRIGVIMEKRV